MNVDISDLLKILDVLKLNSDFHYHRDSMNANLHLAKETRYSPLTSETMSARDRLVKIIHDDEK